MMKKNIDSYILLQLVRGFKDLARKKYGQEVIFTLCTVDDNLELRAVREGNHYYVSTNIPETMEDVDIAIRMLEHFTFIENPQTGEPIQQ